MTNELKQAIEKRKLRNSIESGNVNDFIYQTATQIAEQIVSEWLLINKDIFLQKFEATTKDAISEVASKLTKNIKKGDKGEKGDSIAGPRGPKGDSIVGPKGDPGETPIAGIHFTLPKDGEDGAPGKDGEHADPEMVLAYIKSLPKGKRLSVEHIDGLQVIINNLRREMKDKKGGWKMRGGGDTVAAGSGISISTSGGVKTISSTGVSFASATGTVDGSNTSFTVAATPLFVVVDNSIFFENLGYSRVGTTITLFFPASSYVKYAY